MRWVGVLFVCLAACYKPSPPGGAPCDPRDPHCPRGQQCVAGTCGTDLGAADAPLELDVATIFDDAAIGDAQLDAPIAMPDATIDAPLPPLHLDYPATIAVCLDPSAPSPSACTNAKGVTNLVVDGADLGHAWNIYLRFELDGQLADRTPTSVSLVATTTDASDAGGPESGEVWKVTAFTNNTVFSVVPTKLGATPLAPSFGPVVASMTYTFSLPLSTAVANQPIYLGILPVLADGVHYWSNAGAVPMKLHIDTL